MNKFDDMMLCMAASVPGFSLVVAVDKDFTLFQRAWCIAELYQAYTLGIPISMRLISENGLIDHESELRLLRVVHMRSSRPEDKELILAKIQDKDAFDAQLQQLLFAPGGLLQSWREEHNVISILELLARLRTESVKMEASSACSTASSSEDGDLGESDGVV
jgi:hypothetical protein